MTPTLDAIRSCLEGAIPAVIVTVSPEGMPNTAYLSHVHFVDEQHVALSFQFFNKTRENILVNPRAVVQVVDPDTAAHYRLAVLYQRTETEGPLFEHMKARLAGIASHTGMSQVFRLLGADVYRVLSIEAVPGTTLPAPLPRRSALRALRTSAARLARCTDLAALLDEVLLCLGSEFGIGHAMLLMYDRSGERLYTVASRGYASSGVGSEIPLGAGVIGVAARERAPIRISHWTADYAYSQAVRGALEADGLAQLETAIPFPGLPAPHSQLAVPIVLRGALLGVLYVESPDASRFSYEDEDALIVLADQLALAMHLLQQAAEVQETPGAAAAVAPRTGGSPVPIRRYAVNDSVFVGEDYLIKGVAGAIFWRLVQEYLHHRRTDFSNRELRLDPAIRLPDISDNLEARLILLQRRLAERCPFLRIEKIGRGRFRLHVDRPITLLDVPAGERPP